MGALNSQIFVNLIKIASDIKSLPIKEMLHKLKQFLVVNENFLLTILTLHDWLVPRSQLRIFQNSTHPIVDELSENFVTAQLLMPRQLVSIDGWNFGDYLFLHRFLPAPKI